MGTFLYRYADLKRKYEIYFRVSLILSLLILIAAFKFSPSSAKAGKIKESEPSIFIVEPEINTRQNNEIPKLPPPPQPVISMNEEVEDIIYPETILNQNEEVVSRPPTNENHRIIVEEEDKIFVAVEEFPEIIGGISTLTEKLYYTEIAKRVGIEGKVIVTIIVDKYGNVIEAQLAKKLFDDLDQIALKAVKELKFKPGRQRGKPVKVQMSIPISFRLK